MSIENMYVTENVLRAFEKYGTIEENHHYRIDVKVKVLGGIRFATDLTITELNQETGDLHSCPDDTANG